MAIRPVLQRYSQRRKKVSVTRSQEIMSFMRGMVEQRTKKEFHMTSNANRGESKEQTVINKRNNKITAVSMHLLEYKCILEYK